jgi:hypothetical protein
VRGLVGFLQTALTLSQYRSAYDWRTGPMPFPLAFTPTRTLPHRGGGQVLGAEAATIPPLSAVEGGWVSLSASPKSDVEHYCPSPMLSIPRQSREKSLRSQANRSFGGAKRGRISATSRAFAS